MGMLAFLVGDLRNVRRTRAGLRERDERSDGRSARAEEGRK